jgi:dienelactone hydrolase
MRAYSSLRMRRFLLLFAFASSLAAAEPERGTLVEHIATRSDPTQSYTLYLPKTYDPATKRYPVLFILDPRGRSVLAAEIFREAAEEYGWILLSSNDTRSDVTGEDPNPRALNGIIPEVDRYAVDRQRIYFTGFSGTAMISWSYALHSARVAGVIGVGGRLIDELPPAKFNFAHYGFAGDSDFNNREMRSIEAILDRESTQPHRFEVFEGEHRWINAALAHDALGWFEVVAMKQKRRTRDDALIAKLFEADVAKAKAVEATSGLDALRRYRAIARTYDGLVPIDAINREIERLDQDRAVQRARKEEAQWDAFEVQYLQDVHSRAAIYIQQGNLSQQYRLSELKQRAKKPGAEGKTAQRLLAATFAQLGHYLPTQLFAMKRYEEAVVTLSAALEIHEDRWPLWYNLGAAHALRRDHKHALDALEKAIAHGFTDADALAADADYANVRSDKRYAALVAKLRRGT